MSDEELVEGIIRNIANSFSGIQSTKDWTDKTIWFDAAPYACIGKDKVIKVFDEAFGNLKSCDFEILDIRTNINSNNALVCSIQKWDIIVKDGSKMSLIMRQKDYLEKESEFIK